MILDALEKKFVVKLPRRAAYTAKDVAELATLVAARASREVLSHAGVPADSLPAARPGFLEDPYPTYARLRDQHPVGWATTQAIGYAGFWFVSRYDDVAAGLKDNRFGREVTRVMPKEAFPPIPEEHKPLYAMLSEWMLFKDPPVHARLRRIAAPVFSLRAVSACALASRS